MRAFLFAAILFMASTCFARSTVDLERNSIERGRATEKQWCSSAINPSQCRKDVDKAYNQKLARLNKDPEQYFYDQNKSRERREISSAVQRELDTRGF